VSRLSNYQDIRDEVLRRLQSRQWAPGDTIPSEQELAAEFACARTTVNRALRELAQLGLLERRRKAGTRVSLHPVRKATLDIPIIRLEIEGRGQTYRHRLLRQSQTPAPDHVTARMDLPRATEMLYLEALHMADDRPYMLETRWINPGAAPGILQAPLDTISANEWLVQNAGFTDGEISLMAEPADTGQAGALNVPPGAALFVSERLTRSGTDAITWVRMAYPPGYKMTTAI